MVTVDGGDFASAAVRAKELIITGRFNVSPIEFEPALRLHAEVKGAAIFGRWLERGREMVVDDVELEA